MTLKIERYLNGRSTTIRLIGRMRAEHLEELKTQISKSGSRISLDLEEVHLVDVEVDHTGLARSWRPPYEDRLLFFNHELPECLQYGSWRHKPP